MSGIRIDFYPFRSPLCFQKYPSELGAYTFPTYEFLKAFLDAQHPFTSSLTVTFSISIPSNISSHRCTKKEVHAVAYRRRLFLDFELYETPA